MIFLRAILLIATYELCLDILSWHELKLSLMDDLIIKNQPMIVRAILVKYDQLCALVWDYERNSLLVFYRYR